MKTETSLSSDPLVCLKVKFELILKFSSKWDNRFHVYVNSFLPVELLLSADILGNHLGHISGQND